MARMIALILAVSSTTAVALVARSQLDQLLESGDKAEMRPDVVSKMLATIENTWQAQAFAFTECKTTGENFNCKEAPKAFLSSCEKVGNVIFLASSGQPEESKEYMNDVCASARIGNSWHRTTCELVSKAMVTRMTVNAEENRNKANVHTAEACKGLWSHFVEEQTAQNEKEKKAEDEEDASLKLADARLSSLEKLAKKKESKKEPVQLAEKQVVAKTLLTRAAPKEEKKIDLNKPMPLKAQEQGFKGKMVQHKDGKTVAKDWRKEYGADVKPEEHEHSASSHTMASLIVLLVSAVLHFSQ